MRFCPEESENSVLTLPLRKSGEEKVIDWGFVEKINELKDLKVRK